MLYYYCFIAINVIVFLFLMHLAIKNGLSDYLGVMDDYFQENWVNCGVCGELIWAHQGYRRKKIEFVVNSRPFNSGFNMWLTGKTYVHRRCKDRIPIVEVTLKEVLAKSAKEKEV